MFVGCLPVELDPDEQDVCASQALHALGAQHLIGSPLYNCRANVVSQGEFICLVEVFLKGLCGIFRRRLWSCTHNSIAAWYSLGKN